MMESPVFLILIALAVSAFFAGSETGYYSLNPLRLRHEANESRSAALLFRVVKNPFAFLAALLIGNNIANDIVMQIGSSLLGSEIYAVVFLTPIVFFFCEMWPKQWMLAHPSRLVWFALPLALVRVFLWPLTTPLSWLMKRVDRDNEGSLARGHFVELLYESQRQAPAESRVMSAALRAISSRGKGLQPYLRYDLPRLDRGASIQQARAAIEKQSDAKALLLNENGPPSLLFGSRLIDRDSTESILNCSDALISLPIDSDLTAAVRHLQIYGLSHAWVIPEKGDAGLFDLEYALAGFFSAVPE